MKKVGNIRGESNASHFCKFLKNTGIECELQGLAQSQSYQVWVIDDLHWQKANDYLQKYLENNQAELFKQTTNTNKNLFLQIGFQKIKVNLTLIMAAIAIAIITNGGDLHSKVVQKMLISAQPRQLLPEIFDGQLWRLFSPALLHFGWAHIIFNMYVFFILGTIVELRFGSQYFFFFALSSAATSNLVQYFVSKNIYFGGMSAVIYAIFGFLWMKSVFDKHLGIVLQKQSIILMLFYFILGFIMPHVANTAHAAGLGYGMFFGYISSSNFKRMIARNHRRVSD